MVGPAQAREQSKLRHVVELYKRQVKADKDVGTRTQVMIRNYRLHVVKDVARELSQEARRLCTLNKGTTIHVANSIIRPEVHSYGTRVTDKLAQAWPALLDDAGARPGKGESPSKKGAFHRRSYSLQQPGARPAVRPSPEAEASLEEQPGDPHYEAARLLEQELGSQQAGD